jgi:hypothetical protein
MSRHASSEALVPIEAAAGSLIPINKRDSLSGWFALCAAGCFPFGAETDFAAAARLLAA